MIRLVIESGIDHPAYLQ